MTGPYEVRVAAFEDLDARTAYRLWQLREAVFVVEQSCPYPELDGRDLEPTTRHVWVVDRQQPVAYLRLLADLPPAVPPGDPATRAAGAAGAAGAADGPVGALRLGRVLVAKAHRGRGLADLVVRTGLDLVGDRPSRLDAQSHLAGWYARYGYRRDGDDFVEDGIPHTPMARP